MERDFMVLISKDSVVAIKEEVVEGGRKGSGFAGGLGVPWPLSNTVSALPHFKPLKYEQDEEPSKNLDIAAIKKQLLVGNPAKLTIFYAGTVNVFDDISPEKVQAITLVAGNTCVSSKLHVQAPTSKLPATDSALVNQSMNMPPCSVLPSPISVSSHTINVCGEEVKVSKSIGLSATLVNKVEPPRMISSIGSLAANAIISSCNSCNCGKETFAILMSFFCAISFNIYLITSNMLQLKCSYLN